MKIQQVPVPVLFIIQKYVQYLYNEQWTSLNHFVFHLPKKEPEPTQLSAPAPAKILNRLRLQPKNLYTDRLRLRNTGNNCKIDRVSLWYTDSRPNYITPNDIKPNDIKPNDI